MIEPRPSSELRHIAADMVSGTYRPTTKCPNFALAIHLRLPKNLPIDTISQDSAGRQMTPREVFWSDVWRRAKAPFRRLRQRLCGVIFHHRPLSNDTGWLIGSKLVDRWCARCGKMVTLPMAEDPHYDRQP